MVSISGILSMSTQYQAIISAWLPFLQNSIISFFACTSNFGGIFLWGSSQIWKQKDPERVFFFRKKGLTDVSEPRILKHRLSLAISFCLLCKVAHFAACVNILVCILPCPLSLGRVVASFYVNTKLQPPPPLSLSPTILFVLILDCSFFGSSHLDILVNRIFQGENNRKLVLLGFRYILRNIAMLVSIPSAINFCLCFSTHTVSVLSWKLK